jgi:CRISPR-associated RAMP protein (TIGR02581 family)
MDFSKFENRYVIEGLLSAENIHIGSGRASGDEDAPTIRYENNLAYIPGSSFRGHLRAKLEGLMGLGLTVADREIDDLDIKMMFGYTNMDQKDQEIVNKRTGIKSGSLAGKIHIEDLVIVHNKKDSIRDGIAIDRNTGTTKKGAKFDYNVIEDAQFNLRITVENAEDYELDLLNIGFNLMKEDIFGGKTSRGIGKSKLMIEKVRYVEKSNLKDYLFTGEMKEGSREILNKGKISL